MSAVARRCTEKALSCARRLSHRSMLETHIFKDSGYQYSTPSADVPRPKKVRTKKPRSRRLGRAL